MEELLRRFNGDIHTKDALLAFMRDHIDGKALEMMYKGENVAHIKDAKTLLEGAFESLETFYGIKDKPKTTENGAR